MTTEEELKDLTKRVTSLEVYFKVALGIAAVFGLSGAVIFALLAGDSVGEGKHGAGLARSARRATHGHAIPTSLRKDQR